MALVDYKNALPNRIAELIYASPILSAVKINNRLDQRTNLAAKKRHERAPGDFVSLAISQPEQSNERQAESTTPTFGLGRAAACDPIIPIRITFLLTYQYDAARWGKEHPSAPAPETEARRQLMSGANYPRLGFNWVRNFTIETRKLSPPKGDSIYTTVEEAIAFDLRLYRSQIAN